MKNIAPGLSLKKYKGNKHEQGGIMVNALGNKTKDINKAVAEVEGGEYSYRSNPNNPKGPYIISAELGTAEIAKQANTFKNNDRISYNTRTYYLTIYSCCKIFMLKTKSSVCFWMCITISCFNIKCRILKIFI
jgi:hypothetical protein